MTVHPIYQTKYVQVEMTQDEVNALKELKMAVAKIICYWKAGGYADATTRNELRLALTKAPEIIELPTPEKPQYVSTSKLFMKINITFPEATKVWWYNILTLLTESFQDLGHTLTDQTKAELIIFIQAVPPLPTLKKDPDKKYVLLQVEQFLSYN